MLREKLFSGLFIIMLLIQYNIYAQNLSIINTVVNDETDEPVAYATVSFPDQQYGFSTNTDGEFRLQIVTSMMDNRIVISSIGFEPFESTIKGVLSLKNNKIRLKPQTTILQEVLIKAKQETPQDIIKNVEKNLKAFMGSQPYYLFAFYKESILSNKKYVGFTEGYGILRVSAYQPGYNRKNSLFAYDLAQWKNLRRSQYQVKSECNDTLPRTLEVDKLVKAKSEYLYNGPFSKTRDDFRYTIDSVTTYNNDDVFVISFVPLSPEQFSYYGNAYVKADDYALLKLEIWDNHPEKLYYEKCVPENMKSHFNLTFTKIGERYYQNNISLTNDYNLNNTHMVEEIEMSGEEFRDNQVAKLNEDQRIIIYGEMLNPDVIYEEGFWLQQDREVDAKVADDLGESVPLPRQFFMSSGKRIIPLPDNYGSYQEMYNDNDVFRMFINSDF